MGQHKTNPTAIKAAKGEIAPKQAKMSKAERDRLLYSMCEKIILAPLTVSVEQNVADADTGNANNKGA